MLGFDKTEESGESIFSTGRWEGGWFSHEPVAHHTQPEYWEHFSVTENEGE